MGKKFMNKRGVSPIVATLVLIVVAIVGAVATAAILGQLSSSTADQASAGDAANQGKIKLLIGGSTTVQPVSNALALAFENANTGINVEVQAGGSDAGMIGAAEGILDLGAISEYSKYVTYATGSGPYATYDMKAFEVGGSGVVPIANGLTVEKWTVEALNQAYDEAVNGKVTYEDVDTDGVIELGEVADTGLDETVTLYQRSDASGTEECFAKWLGNTPEAFKTAKNVDASTALGREGNAGVYAAVKGATGEAIGFVDFGFIVSGEVDIVQMYKNDASAPLTGFSDMTKIKDAIKSGLKGTTVFGEGDGLTRNLYYVTKGNPSATEQAFLDFARSPASLSAFTSVGYFGIYDYKTA